LPLASKNKDPPAKIDRSITIDLNLDSSRISGRLADLNKRIIEKSTNMPPHLNAHSSNVDKNNSSALGRSKLTLGGPDLAIKTNARNSTSKKILQMIHKSVQFTTYDIVNERVEKNIDKRFVSNKNARNFKAKNISLNDPSAILNLTNRDSCSKGRNVFQDKGADLYLDPKMTGKPCWPEKNDTSGLGHSLIINDYRSFNLYSPKNKPKAGVEMLAGIHHGSGSRAPNEMPRKINSPVKVRKKVGSTSHNYSNINFDNSLIEDLKHNDSNLLYVSKMSHEDPYMNAAEFVRNLNRDNKHRYAKKLNSIQEKIQKSISLRAKDIEEIQKQREQQFSEDRSKRYKEIHLSKVTERKRCMKK
jgi:hypothetical protein